MSHAASSKPRAADYVGHGVASKVPDKSHYNRAYLGGGRMFSFAHQVEEALAFNPKRVLEVGVGTGVVKHILQEVAKIEVQTLDIELSLQPDVLGSVAKIPLDDSSFDIVICCQVLEHLPFSEFETALREIRRVATRGCVLSIPDMTRRFAIDMQIPRVGRRSLSITVGPAQSAIGPAKFDQMDRDGHYWEVGLKGVKPKDIAQAMRNSGWNIRRQWRNSHLPWHHFYVLEP